MRLSEIEMQGFKSFADKTKLTFENGITAIVGPNGSGKSNVSDAVKWVFGEQSVKSLRGAKMEDVIFGGTKNRNAQGFASVALTIDNSDRQLDIDNDKVTISRKLYRSGESEYRINGASVRMKDVSELFMDTGLGKYGYSIVEQGKVAEIVSSKGNERREILEEAAGISKFRYRRAEAERKLEGAEENLLRLNDIMSELEGRVEPLRIEAEKAQKYIVYMDERKGLEIGLWIKSLNKMQSDLRELSDNILISCKDKERVEQKLSAIEDELLRCEEKSHEFASYIDIKRNEIKSVEESVNNAKIDIAVKTNDLEHLKQDRQAAEEIIKAGDDSREQLKNELSALTDKNRETKEKISEKEKEIEDIENLLKDADKNASEIKEALLLNSGKQRDIKEKINLAEVSAKTSETLTDETYERLTSIQSGENENERLENLKKELKKIKYLEEDLKDNLEALNNSITGYGYKIASREESFKKISDAVRVIEKDAGAKLSHAQLLSDMEKNMEGFGGSVKTVIKRAEMGALRGIHGTVASLIETDDKYAVALEIALGFAMQNIVTDTTENAKRAISMLKSMNGGRATFLPMDTVKGTRINDGSFKNERGYIGIGSDLVKTKDEYDGIIKWLLGRTIICEDIDSAIAISKRTESRYRAVSLDGQVVNAGGSLTGGSAGKSGSILSRKNEIERLNSEAKELTEKLKAYEEKLNAESEELSRLKAVQEGVKAEKQAAIEDIATVAGDKKRILFAIEQEETRESQLKEEIERLNNKLSQLKEQNKNSRSISHALNDELLKLSDESDRLSAENEKLQQKIVSCKEERSQLIIKKAEYQKDSEVILESAEAIKQQLEGSTALAIEKQAKLAEITEKESELLRAIDDNNALLENSDDVIAGLKNSISAKQAEAMELEKKVTELRKSEKEIGSEKEAIVIENSRLEERKVAIEGKIDDIVKTMWDDYELTRSEAQDFAIEITDDQKANKRLNELKSKIKALGTVNLGSVDEYKEVSERYNFLKAQIDDAAGAKEELLRLISRLSSDMSRIFTQKFEIINDNFKSIFKELFGGGRAELILTEPDKPLESAIDIFVEPPGKIIKNLSALSGGEQSFVAICIYFAILKESPAPFVLLDEIEAALDDVNVARFAAYLKKMTDNTQFIAITHRRGTMEEADVLYGVTMEQEGISKLLRLNVGEMEHKLKMSIG